MKFHFIPILVDEFWSFFREILMIFFRISWIFSENDEMSRDFDKNCQKNAEKGRKFWNFCKISFVHFIFSILSLRMSRGERVGAKTTDLEWVQVHPTGLVKTDDPNAKILFLAAEALRGVGGLLFDANGNRFTDRELFEVGKLATKVLTGTFDYKAENQMLDDFLKSAERWNFCGGPLTKEILN